MATTSKYGPTRDHVLDWFTRELYSASLQHYMSSVPERLSRATYSMPTLFHVAVVDYGLSGDGGGGGQCRDATALEAQDFPA